MAQVIKPTTKISDVKTFFGGSTGDFMKEWKELSDKDKEQIKAGFADGTLNY